jgi:hypothetical protein
MATMRRPTVAAVLVLIVFLTASGSSGGAGAAARPLPSTGAGQGAGTTEHTGIDTSAQPSNCTYGNNTGGQCPPSPVHN